jgi:hypothetical protein
MLDKSELTTTKKKITLLVGEEKKQTVFNPTFVLTNNLVPQITRYDKANDVRVKLYKKKKIRTNVKHKKNQSKQQFPRM